MGEVEREDAGDRVSRKEWRPPTLEVLPMHETEVTFRGTGADGALDYS